MMMIRSLILAGSFSLLAGCSPQNPQTDELTREDSLSLPQAETPQTSQERPQATAFYRPGHELPEGVDTGDGELPRDDYGRPYTYQGLGRKLPSFSAEMANGELFQSDRLEGRWTLVKVWGLWCHDSRRDSRYAAALATALQQDPDIDFITIHTPQNAARIEQATGSYDSVASWLAENGAPFPVLIDQDAGLRKVLQIRWTPSYLLIAPDLSVQGFRTGLADAGDEAVKDFVQDIARSRGAWQSSD